MADLLVALFYLPTRHLHEYSRLLLKLATCFEVVGETNVHNFSVVAVSLWLLSVCVPSVVQ